MFRDSATESLKYTIDDDHSEFHEKVEAEINGLRQHFDVGLSYDYINIPGLIKGLTELQWFLDNLENIVKTVIPSEDRVYFMLKGVDKSVAIKKIASMGISVKSIMLESLTEASITVGYEAVNHTFTCIFSKRKLLEVDGSD